MALREVVATRKDYRGDITALCNSKEFWSPRYKTDAINDIENRVHQYYVMVSGIRVDIHVVDDRVKGKYLRTDPDKTITNNLDNLPDC